jgi:lysophospholipase L1-like esterase
LKKWLKNIIALCFGLFLSFLLIEIVLHLYNPFQTRVRGGHIVLPVNLTYEFDQVNISGLDSHIVHKKNKLGFRGPEIPEEKSYRIFCVGGSTTECFYLSDGKDWPALLMAALNKKYPQVWVNNAGLDGHSTRGHEVLLRDQLLQYKPNMVVFLVGCNDVAAGEFNRFEKGNMAANKRLLEYSELFNIYHNYQMARNARKRGLGHTPVNFTLHPHSDTSGWRNAGVDTVQLRALQAYAGRIEALGKLCKAKGAVPVFVTQPTILDNKMDVSGRYLGDLEFQGASALHYRVVLEQYNGILKTVCARNNWQCIDAASELTSSSKNYYDFFHYTNQGAAEMARIISKKLAQNNYWQ